MHKHMLIKMLKDSWQLQLLLCKWSVYASTIILNAQGEIKLNVFKSLLYKTIEISLSFADSRASSDMSHFCGVGTLRSIT